MGLTGNCRGQARPPTGYASSLPGVIGRCRGRASPPYGRATSIQEIIVAKFIVSTKYLFSITDSETGAVFWFPITSLSVSSRNGSPSKINVTIPYTVEYADSLAGLSDGLLKVYRSQTDNEGDVNTSLVEYGALTTLQTYVGARSASIALIGTSIKVNTLPKIVRLNGLSYVAVSSGKKRIRCSASNNLMAGDTVEIEGHSFLANNIQLNVTASTETMEVYE
jgi:hypothetical protein